MRCCYVRRSYVIVMLQLSHRWRNLGRRRPLPAGIEILHSSISVKCEPSFLISPNALCRWIKSAVDALLPAALLYLHHHLHPSLSLRCALFNPLMFVWPWSSGEGRAQTPHPVAAAALPDNGWASQLPRSPALRGRGRSFSACVHVGAPLWEWMHACVASSKDNEVVAVVGTRRLGGGGGVGLGATLTGAAEASVPACCRAFCVGPSVRPSVRPSACRFCGVPVRRQDGWIKPGNWVSHK